jgi:hypothetical protein
MIFSAPQSQRQSHRARRSGKLGWRFNATSRPKRCPVIVIGMDMATSTKVSASSGGLDVDASSRCASYQKPRLILELDVPWMVDLGNRRYGNQYDRFGTEMWFRNIVLRGPMMFWPARTDNAFCVAMISTTPWRPEAAECNVVLVCAEDGHMWEAIALLRASLAWAKRRKCSLWRLSSETDFDLASIAAKLGATEANVRYVKRLE